jgi:hypothetical protein
MAKKYSIAEARAAVYQKKLKAKKGTFEVGLPHETLTRHGGRNSRGIRVAVAILEACHRCGKQRILVCPVYSEWLNLLVYRQCALEALRLIQ